MKPNFALNLSHEGISLLHRATAGWLRVGDVALDDPDLNDHLRILRKTAADLESGGLTSKLVIPNSQVLYTEVEAPGPDTAARIAQIRDGLIGLTPYDVNDLVFDWRLFGTKAQVAVVARETLTEAEAFAAEFRFNPVSFVAVPMNADFEGEPYFGLTEHAASLLEDGETIEPDSERMEVLGSGQKGKPRKTKASATTKATPEAEPVDADFAITDTPPETHGADDAPAAAEKSEKPKPKAKAKRKPNPKKPAATTEVADEADDLAPMPVTFSTRRAEPMPPPATERVAPPPLDPVPPRSPSANAFPAEPNVGVTFSHVSALDLDDVPEMPAWQNAEGPRVTPMAMTAAHTADPIPEAAPTPDQNNERRAAAASARDAALAAGTALAGGLGKLGQGTAASMRKMRTRKNAQEASATEADSMTVFGARGTGRVGGKPRYLGLILTLLLLLALAIMALWSTFFLTDGENAWFGNTPDQPQIAAVDPTQTPADDVTIPADNPEVITPEITAPEIATPDITAPEITAPEQITTELPAAPDTPLVSAIESAIEDVLTAPPAEDATETPEVELALLPAPVPTPTPTPTDNPPPDRIVQPPPTRAQAEASYAVTGVWQMDPEPLPGNTGGDRLEGLVVASIDASVPSQAAVVLPGAASLGGDLRPTTLTPPAALGIRYDLDERGLVRATTDGSLSPEGTLVYAGLPPVVPPLRPGTEPVVEPVQPTAEAPAVAPEATVENAETTQPEPPETEPSAEPVEIAVPAPDPELLRLSEIRPAARPDGQQDVAEQPNLGGFSESALAAIRPRIRPLSLQEQSAIATADPDESELAEEPEDETAALETATELAVEASLQPSRRPSDFASTVQKALAEANASAPANTAPEREVAAAVAPSIPSRASVANQATERNAINLGRVNLIGVYGSPSDRRALVRLKSGRYIKVEVGDDVDGGRVAAIGDDELRYIKRGKNITLKLPSG